MIGRMKRNVSQVVHEGLCLGCGICYDACPKDCIKIIHGNELNYPSVNETCCIECSRCLKVCSGRGIDMKKYTESLFDGESLNFDKYLGYYDKCFSGFSLDYEIRYHSASGGCLSGFLIYLLDKKIIDGALVVGWDSVNPMQPRPYIAKTKEDIISARSSKYCVVSYEGMIQELQKSEGKYVMVGLPCHIHSIKKYCSISKSISNKIIGCFAIYCSSNRTRLSQSYLLYRYKVKTDSIRSFSYRDNGCLGSMIFKDGNGKILKSVPYPDYWIGMRGFFNVPRCSLCIDHYGELSSVSFGDLHVGEFIKDKIGISSIISRSPYWTGLLKMAVEEGYLKLDVLDADVLKSSQQYAVRQKKGIGVASAFKLRAILKHKNPQYNVSLISNYTLVGLLKELLKYTMQFIGRHRQLWFIIRLLDRQKR